MVATAATPIVSSNRLWEDRTSSFQCEIADKVLMTTSVAPFDFAEARAGVEIAVVTSGGRTWTWEEVYAQFAPMIRSYARSRGVTQADDIVQEVFASIVGRLPEFDGDEAGLRSLMFKVAFRRIADDHRRTYRSRETLVASHDPVPALLPTVEETVAARCNAQEALNAFSILSPRERTVLKMRLVEDMSPGEVAQAMALSGVNVRVIQARALAKLRNHLIAKNNGEPWFGVGLVFGTLRSLTTRWDQHPLVQQLSDSPGSLRFDAGRGQKGLWNQVSGLPSSSDSAHTTFQSLLQTAVQHGATGVLAAVSVIAMATPNLSTLAEAPTPTASVSVSAPDSLSRVGAVAILDSLGPSGVPVPSLPQDERQEEAEPADAGDPELEAPVEVGPDPEGGIAGVVESSLDTVTGVLGTVTDGLLVPILDEAVELVSDLLPEIEVVEDLADDVLVPVLEDTADHVDTVTGLLKGLFRP